MSAVESWSDGEIRSKLAQLGTPVGPVTETTRSVLVKKLKQLLQQQQQQQGEEQRKKTKSAVLLSRFSSGEEEEEEEEDEDHGHFGIQDGGGKQNNVREQDSPYSMPPPPPSAAVFHSRTLRRRTIGGSKDVSAALPGRNVGRSGRKSMSSMITTTAKMADLDSGSDSDVPLFANVARAKGLSRSPLHGTSRGPSPMAPNPEQQQDPDSDSCGTATYRQISPGNRSGTVRVIPRMALRRQEEEREEAAAPASEYQSDFLSRLQAGSRPGGDGTYRRGGAWSSREAGIYPRTSITPDRYGAGLEPSSYRKRLSAATRDFLASASSPSSRLLPSAAGYPQRRLFLLFLSLLAALLLGTFLSGHLRPAAAPPEDPSRPPTDASVFPLCDSASGGAPDPCIESRHLQPALDLVHLLAPKLREMALEAFCNGSAAGSGERLPPSLSEEEAVVYLRSMLPADVKKFQVEQDLRRMKLLVMANPHWPLRVVPDPDSPPAVAADVKKLIVTGGLSASDVHAPLSCLLRYYVNVLAAWLAYAAAAALVAGVVAYVVRAHRARRERHESAVYDLVGRVLALLAERHARDGAGAATPVDNCRDELIPPALREATRRVWEAAADFVERHESRVRTEVRSVRGENVRVWRWLPAEAAASPDTDAGSPTWERLL